MFCISQIFSISKPSWQCRIREGMAGMVRAQWSPDARHVLTFSDYSLHMSIWSLSTKQVLLCLFYSNVFSSLLMGHSKSLPERHCGACMNRLYVSYSTNLSIMYKSILTPCIQAPFRGPEHLQPARLWGFKDVDTQHERHPVVL